jgi:hypothetical protein
MTIAIAWIRKIRDCDELVFVSDSRLSGDGRVFDGCAKILTLPRPDCAISFGGYTGAAFPMLLQLALAIDSHSPSKRGSLDLVSLRTHMLKVFDSMAGQIQSSEHVSKPQDTNPGATFLFGGYSWIRKRFRLWSISYRPKEKRFAAEPSFWLGYSVEAKRIVLRKRKKELGDWNFGRIAFTGDQAPLAKKLLLEKLNAAWMSGATQKTINMEPFEVVRDMLRDENHAESIGGAPQIVKVYQYMRSTPLAVYWPQKQGGRIHLQGRACLDYERVDNWVVDPDTLESARQPVPIDPSIVTNQQADSA